MLKKHLAQLFIFILLFLTWIDATHLRSDPTTGKISLPLPFFPAIQIKLLESSDEGIVEDALRNTTQSLLHYLCPQLKKEPWHSQHIFINLLGNHHQEVVISMSLPPDHGILVILQKQNDYYIPLYYVRDLLPVTRLHKLNLRADHDILITREEHDERLGAFTESHLIKIWGWHDQKPEILWSEYSFWEINLPPTWLNQDRQEKKWFKMTQNFTFNYRLAPQPVIHLEGSQALYSAPASDHSQPEPSLFEIQKTRLINRNFVWSEEWHRFILHTGLLTTPGADSERIAVTKDMDDHLDTLIESDEKFEVINKQGDVFKVNKALIRLDP